MWTLRCGTRSWPPAAGILTATASRCSSTIRRAGSTRSGRPPAPGRTPPGIRIVIRSARRVPPRMRAEVEYRAGGRVWTHAWESYEIGAEELEGDLSSAGLRFGRWLTGDQAWFTARPA